MTQSNPLLTISKKTPALNLSQANSLISNLATVSKSCERSSLKLQIRRFSPDSGSQGKIQSHRQISNTLVKVPSKPRDLTPSNQLLRQRLSILSAQIQEFSLKNAELRKSLQNSEPVHIKSLKSELKILKSHHKLLKSKIKAQSKTLNPPQPAKSPDPEHINLLKSAQISQSQYFKSKFTDLKHQILLTSQSIQSFSQHLSAKKLSCRQKLLKIQAALRESRKTLNK